MISKNRLKEIILSNEEFILTQIKKIVKRERIYLPENLDKVVVFYGVRRSGKTFILFDLFKKMSERSLYIDFEDERLVDFQEKGECDFIVRNQEDKFLPIQVSFELTEENREREIKGLIDACKWLEINKGVILTYDEEAELNVGRIYIEILPIWKWLLANNRV